MKRASYLLLAALMAFSLTACSKAEGFEQEKAALQKIQGDLVEMNELIEQLLELNDLQETIIKYNLDFLRTELESGGYRDFDEIEEDYEDVLSYMEDLEICMDKVREIESSLPSLPQNSPEQARITIDAAKRYCKETLSVMESLQMMLKFYIDDFEATEDFNAFDSDQYSSYDLMLEKLYDVTNDAAERYRAMDCPDFLRPLFERYVDQLDLFSYSIYTQYLALAYDDYLRAVAGENLVNRIVVQVTLMEIELNEDVLLQHDKIVERINGRLKTLGDELESNCELLLANM